MRGMARTPCSRCYRGHGGVVSPVPGQATGSVLVFRFPLIKVVGVCSAAKT
jgi:hypothetical protein